MRLDIISLKKWLQIFCILLSGSLTMLISPQRIHGFNLNLVVTIIFLQDDVINIQFKCHQNNNIVLTYA